VPSHVVPDVTNGCRLSGDPMLLEWTMRQTRTCLWVPYWRLLPRYFAVGEHICDSRRFPSAKTGESPWRLTWGLSDLIFVHVLFLVFSTILFYRQPLTPESGARWPARPPSSGIWTQYAHPAGTSGPSYHKSSRDTSRPARHSRPRRAPVSSTPEPTTR